MQSVKILREAGFTVQPATDAIGCTEVRSNKLFYFYNPKFVSSLAEVFDKLQPADFHDGRYRLIIAGNCPPDDGQVPLSIVNAEMREEAARLYDKHESLRKEARSAEQNFYNAIRQMVQ